MSEKELGYDTRPALRAKCSTSARPNPWASPTISVSRGTLAFAQWPPKNAGKTKGGRRRKGLYTTANNSYFVSRMKRQSRECMPVFAGVLFIFKRKRKRKHAASPFVSAVLSQGFLTQSEISRIFVSTRNYKTLMINYYENAGYALYFPCLWSLKTASFLKKILVKIDLSCTVIKSDQLF